MKKRKAFLLVFLVVHGVLCVRHSSAQAPQAIPYQAVARDASGNLIANHPIDLRFSIIDSVITGPVIYQEIHHVITNDLGLFNLTIFKANTSTTGTFDPNKWGKLAKFIKVEMDADASGVYTDMGTQQMLSVPFALYANVAGTTGSVTYKGTWNAHTNEPHLESSIGSNGDFYVVINASPDTSQNTELNGNKKYLIGDAVIYNNGIYMRFKTSDVPVTGGDVTFTPGSGMVSTNVQDAIDEVDAKWQVLSSQGSVVYKGTWNVSTNSPPLSDGVGTKGFYYVVSNAGSRSLGGNSDWNVGDWAIYNGTAWEKVDNSTAPVNANDVSFTPAGNITATDVGGALRQLDNRFPFTVNWLTKDNTDPYVPAGDYNPATKKYVDDHASSAVPNGTAFGQTLHWDGTTWVADSGVYSNGKRFGIGITQPEAPLGIMEDVDGSVISVQPRDLTKDPLKIALRTSTGGSYGLDIGQQSSSGLKSRLFIQETDGNIGIGTIQPMEMLHLESNILEDRKLLGLRVSNGAATPNHGWSFGHVHDATVSSHDGAFSIFENGDIPTQDDERITIRPGGNVGINETLPYATLHVTRPLSDPNTDASLIPGTGIMVIGPITDNIVADYRGIQARTGTYVAAGLQLSTSTLNLQRLGGDVLIHGSSISDERKFIIKDDGKIGIGTLTPSEKLHIEDASSGGIVGLKISNTATSANQGWIIGHQHDNTGSDADGALVVKPVFTPGGGGVFTIQTNGRVGVNEPLPYATLHVSRAVTDPQSEINLNLGSGTMMLGQSDGQNLVFDNHQIQSRLYNPLISYTVGDAAALGLQPRGGDILIHGSSSAASSRVLITDAGLVGLGKTPVERLDLDGAIKIGTTTSSNEGTIRYTGSDFEGRKGGAWVSLTSGSNTNGFISSSTAGTIYYDPSSTPRVGIGVSTPSSTLHVSDHSSVSSDNNTVLIENSSITIGTTTYTRAGLKIVCDGTWSSNPAAKNIGLHISSVSGQSSSNSNIAAVMNGNVVVGNLIGSQMVGTNGRNVLAIQNGSAPTSAISNDLGTADGGVQLYSQGDVSGVSVFNVMNGDGTIIKLYRASALTPADNSTISSTYGSNEAAIIKNMRDRINDIESKLQTFGLLP